MQSRDDSCLPQPCVHHQPTRLAARWTLLVAASLLSACGQVQVEVATGAADTGLGLPMEDTVGGGGDWNLGDAAQADAASDAGDTADDTADDTVAADTSPDDTTTPDTTAADTVAADTTAADTVAADTLAADSAGQDTGGCEFKGGETCNGVDDDCDGKTDEGTCDDGDVCTIDACKGVVGCSHSPAQGPCDDGEPCTTGDSCAQGGCVGGPAPDCSDLDPCTQDYCKPGVGCSHVSGFGSCDDGNPCTQNDACSGGTCEGTPFSCDDNNLCTIDTCDKTSGCQYAPNDGAPCNADDWPCTGPDLCAGGMCKPGPKISCDDGNICTADACNGQTGCQNSPLSAGPGSPAPCDDGNVCTLDDACNAGSCASGSAKSCDDGVACTDDVCDPKSGCVHTNATTSNGTPAACDDGDACSSGDTCVDGKCKATGSTSCDDGNACTVDGCASNGGCSHSNATEGSSCSGGSCASGVCQAASSCAGGQLQGNHAIGAGGAYPTFAAALAALQTKGVCGPTTFVVAGGDYKEAGFLFKPIPGASAKAPVRFEAAAGQTVRLVGSLGSGSYVGVVKIDTNTAWLTLVGFDIDGKEAANKIGGSYSGPIVFGSGGGQSHVRIERFFVHDFGPAAWASVNYIGGVYLQQSAKTEAIEFIGNRFENLAPGTAFHTQGGIATRNGSHSGMRIIGNTFVGIDQMACIRLRNGAGWSDLIIANNVFVVGSALQALHWYGTNAVLDSALFVHNSVLLTAGGNAISGNVSAGTTDVRNNAVVALSGGSFVAATNVSPYGANCLQGVTAPVGVAVAKADVSGAVAFSSTKAPYDLHLGPASACANAGVLVPTVLDDIDGQPRSNPPDIGADELP